MRLFVDLGLWGINLSKYLTLEHHCVQILNVYYPKYEMGGKLWPIMHNTIVFSLVLTQFIALGVFTIKKAPIATGFTIMLLIGTILFNEYCRQRFARIFNSYSAQVIMMIVHSFISSSSILFSF